MSRPISSAHSIGSGWPLLFLSVTIFVVTSFDGGTTHLSAFFLRAIAGAVCIVLWKDHPTIALRGRDLAAPLLAMLVVGVGVAVAPNRGIALQAFLTVAYTVLVYVTFLLTPRDHTGAALRVAVGAGIPHSIMAIWQFGTQAHARAAGGFFSPTDLGALLAPLFVFALSRSSVSRAFLAAGVVLGAGLIAAGSRAALLGAAAGLAVLGLKRSRYATVVAIVGVIALTATVPTLRQRFSVRADPYAYSRLQIWRASVIAAWEEPLGVGLNFFEEALRYRGIPLEGWVRYPKTANTAHNEVLNAWAELGIPGLIVSLGAPVSILLAIRRRRRAEIALGANRTWHEDLAMFFAFAFPACLSASLHVPLISMLAAVWAARVSRRDTQPGTSVTLARGATRRSVPAIAVALLLGASLPGAAAHGLSLRARALEQAGQTQRALELMNVAVAVSPWMLSHALQRARLHLTSGSPTAESADVLLELAQRFPYAPRPLTFAAELLRAQLVDARDADERWKVIAAILAEAAHRDPRNALLWTDLGLAHLRAGGHSQAARSFERAVQEEPNCARPLAELARLAAEDHRQERAIALGRRALAATRHARLYGGRGASILSLPPASVKMLAELGVRDP